LVKVKGEFGGATHQYIANTLIMIFVQATTYFVTS